MTISAEITKLQTNLASSYTKCNAKGATMPASQNFDNLPSTIESIPSGGGGGSTVDVKACGTETYTTDDKVILTPTDNLFDDTLYGENNSGTGYIRDIPFYCQGRVLDYSKAEGNYNLGSGANKEVLTWNADKTAVTASFQTGGESRTDSYCVEYEDGNNYAIFINSVGYSGDPDGNVTLGTYRSGVFSGSMTAGNYAGHCLVQKKNWAAGNGSVYDLSTNNSYNISGGSNRQIPMKYNNTWYIVDAQASGGVYALSDLSTKLYNFSGWSFGGNDYTYKFLFLDDSVDYLFVNAASSTSVFNWKFIKINKNNSTWTYDELPNVTAAILEAVNPDNETAPYVTLQAKDWGDTIEIFAIGKRWGYNSSNGGHCVAHFIFTKSTGTIIRKPDVFPELASTYIRSYQLSVNWLDGLVSVMLVNASAFNSNGATQNRGLYIKKFDELAGAYPYYAYPNQRGNYYQDSITGFVKSNKGVDELGNTVLEVECTEDPNHSWNPVGRVLGMTITVNEGEPV